MPDSEKSIKEAVAAVQRAVAVPKDRYNEFGRFSYRSFEDIVSALKEPCREAGISFFMNDEVVQVGDRYYVKATVCVFFTDEPSEEMLAVSAYAREADHKNGSDDAQVTGMASSYARKYALCGAFAIDGESDPDCNGGAEEPPSGPFVAHCKSCGTRYTFSSWDEFQAWVPTAQCCPAPAWEAE